MSVAEPLTFAAAHVGRGGEVSCRWTGGELRMALEMSGGGGVVWLRGALVRSAAGKERRLRTGERKLVGVRLREWLDATGRTEWAIER